MLRIANHLLLRNGILLILLFLSITVTTIDSAAQYPKRTEIKRVKLTEYVFRDSRIESIIDSLVFWPKSLEHSSRYYPYATNYNVWKYIVMDMFLTYTTHNPTQIDTLFRFTFSDKLRYYYDDKSKGYTTDSKGFFLLREKPIIIEKSYLGIPDFLIKTERKSVFVDTVRVKVYNSFEEAFHDALFYVEPTDVKIGMSFYIVMKNATFTIKKWGNLGVWELAKRPWERIPKLPNIQEKLQRETVKPLTNRDTIIKRKEIWKE